MAALAEAKRIEGKGHDAKTTLKEALEDCEPFRCVAVLALTANSTIYSSFSLINTSELSLFGQILDREIQARLNEANWEE